MSKALFLICPTDFIEFKVNNVFNYQNYFYSSLGNSFVYNAKTIKSLKALIIKHKIKNIYFVLSSDNRFILDALGGQSFSKINCLQPFYNEICKQKRLSQATWEANNDEHIIISYFLNCKIEQLRLELNDVSNHSLNIKGKIYDRFNNTFKTIYSNLTWLEKHNLN